MDDEANRRILTVAATGGAIGLVAGIMSGIVRERHGSWGAFFRGLVASVLAAMLVALGLDDAGLSPTTWAAIIAVVAYLADDVLLGLNALAKLFGADPIAFIGRVWSAIRGGKP